MIDGFHIESLGRSHGSKAQYVPDARTPEQLLNRRPSQPDMFAQRAHEETARRDAERREAEQREVERREVERREVERREVERREVERREMEDLQRREAEQREMERIQMLRAQHEEQERKAERDRREAAELKPPMAPSQPVLTAEQRERMNLPPKPQETPLADRNEDLDREIKAQVEQVVRTEIEELALLQTTIDALQTRADQRAEYLAALDEHSRRDAELRNLQQHIERGQYEQAAQRVLLAMENNAAYDQEIDEFASLEKPPVLGFHDQLSNCQRDMVQWRAYFRN